MCNTSFRQVCLNVATLLRARLETFLTAFVCSVRFEPKPPYMLSAGSKKARKADCQDYLTVSFPLPGEVRENPLLASFNKAEGAAAGPAPEAALQPVKIEKTNLKPQALQLKSQTKKSRSQCRRRTGAAMTTRLLA